MSWILRLKKNIKLAWDHVLLVSHFAAMEANNEMSCASDICNEFGWQLVKSGLADLLSNRTMFRSSEVNMGTCHAWSWLKIDILHTALCSYNLQSFLLLFQVSPSNGWRESASSSVFNIALPDAAHDVQAVSKKALTLYLKLCPKTWTPNGIQLQPQS